MSQLSFLTQQDYVKYVYRKKRQIQILRALVAICFFGLWELAAKAGWINAFIFSSPSRVIKSFCTMIVDKTLFFHIGVTLAETLSSFLLVILVSIFLAILLWWNDSLSKVMEPYLVILNSLPKSALAPILIVWLGNNMKTIIITAISVAVFGSILNIYTGFKDVDPDKLKLIQTLKGSKLDCLKLVILPSSITTILSVMKVNIGLSLVGVIIGEFLAAKAGLGYLIIYGSQVFKMDWVMMSIVILCGIAIGLYQLLNFAEKSYLKKI